MKPSSHHQKEDMKVSNYDDKYYELSTGYIVDRGEYEEIIDKNKQKYVIYQYSKEIWMKTLIYSKNF